MFIEVNPVGTCDSILINLDHVTKIEHKTPTTIVITDIHTKKIVCVYTVEIANVIERLKCLGHLTIFK